MLLAFYRGEGDWRDRLIRWWTAGRFSHVELAVAECDGEYLCYTASPRDGGIRHRWMKLPTSHWELVPLPDHLVRREVIEWFVDRTGAGYDWFGLLGFIARPHIGRSSRYFCSEAIACALGFEDGWRFDPNALYSIARGIK